MSLYIISNIKSSPVSIGEKTEIAAISLRYFDRKAVFHADLKYASNSTSNYVGLSFSR